MSVSLTPGCSSNKSIAPAPGSFGAIYTGYTLHHTNPDFAEAQAVILSPRSVCFLTRTLEITCPRCPAQKKASRSLKTIQCSCVVFSQSNERIFTPCAGPSLSVCRFSRYSPSAACSAGGISLKREQEMHGKTRAAFHPGYRARDRLLSLAELYLSRMDLR